MERKRLSKPETAIEKAAKISEKVVQEEAEKSVEVIKRRDLHSEFMAMSSEERIERFYSFKSQSLHQVEPWQAMSGPSAPGGGSKSKIKKNNNKGNKVYQDAWEGV